MNIKVDWDKIPEGYDWVAKDCDGNWFAYNLEPEIDHGFWFGGGKAEHWWHGAVCDSITHDNGLKWQDSCVARSAKTKTKGTIYIAGPMTGYDSYNFEAFFNAEEYLKGEGWDVINPARIDMDLGFDPDNDVADEEFMTEARKRDANLILDDADAIFLLDGWEKSKGAMAEAALGEWCGLTLFSVHEGEFFETTLNFLETVDADEDILDEAKRLTSGDRQNQYGPPTQDFDRTAKMWSALFGHEFKSKDVATAMICLKLSRETHQGKRDNWTDICGYARCGYWCMEDE